MRKKCGSQIDERGRNQSRAVIIYTIQHMSHRASSFHTMHFQKLVIMNE